MIPPAMGRVTQRRYKELHLDNHDPHDKKSRMHKCEEQCYRFLDDLLRRPSRLCPALESIPLLCEQDALNPVSTHR
jgi:hypothetical protein